MKRSPINYPLRTFLSALVVILTLSIFASITQAAEKDPQTAPISGDYTGESSGQEKDKVKTTDNPKDTQSATEKPGFESVGVYKTPEDLAKALKESEAAKAKEKEAEEKAKEAELKSDKYYDHKQDEKNDKSDPKSDKFNPPGDTSGEQVYQSFAEYPQVSGQGCQRIVECAKKMVGYVTASAETEGGRLGCAAAVSEILKCAGGEYEVGKHLSTVTLFDALKQSGKYEKLHEGQPIESYSSQLKPGDILVTKRASAPGHTGIYISESEIIHNDSGSGTIKPNSNVVKWRSVTARNVPESAVFRCK